MESAAKALANAQQILSSVAADLAGFLNALELGEKLRQPPLQSRPMRSRHRRHRCSTSVLWPRPWSDTLSSVCDTA
jgi:hypothetical protein